MGKKKNLRKAFQSVTKIEMTPINGTIKVRDLVEGYVNNLINEEGGVSSMNNRMTLRPKYQRGYIADLEPMWCENLINSILCGYPINRIYIGVDESERDKPSFSDWALEMLDGQQRSITICDYVKGNFSITIDGYRYAFHNLSKEQQEAILDYPIDVTYCVGPESARIAWFKRINQPNSILTPQELRNATYIGEWLEAAKKFFSATSSKSNRQINDKNDKYCAGNYSAGRRIERSEYLELAIDWVAYDVYPDLRGKADEDDRIIRYMAEHQHDMNANEIIEHYKAVIDWVNDVFFHDGAPKSWQSVRTQEWGRIYSEYKNLALTNDEKLYISKRTKEIVSYGAAIYQISDGIYEWVLRGEKDEEVGKYLHLRGFKLEDKVAMYNTQGGIDPITGAAHPIEDMESHHIIPWKNGGQTIYDNQIVIHKDTHKNLDIMGLTPQQIKEKRDTAIAKRTAELIRA